MTIPQQNSSVVGMSSVERFVATMLGTRAGGRADLLALRRCDILGSRLVGGNGLRETKDRVGHLSIKDSAAA